MYVCNNSLLPNPLGGLLLLVQDLAQCEQAERTMTQDDSADNLGPPPSPLSSENTGIL